MSQSRNQKRGPVIIVWVGPVFVAALDTASGARHPSLFVAGDCAPRAAAAAAYEPIESAEKAARIPQGGGLIGGIHRSGGHGPRSRVSWLGGAGEGAYGTTDEDFVLPSLRACLS